MEQVAFGPFSVDVAARRLRRGTAELALRPQAFRALNLLIQNAGQYVNHDQMIREAWDGISVSRNTISVTIAEVKKTLQEYGGWIRCRPKLGYVLEVPRGEDLIKKGWHLWERRTREGLEKALACFEEAAAEDASDFRAFEGISLSYLLLCTYGMRPPLDTYPKFLEAHNRAVALAGLTTALRSNRAHALHICERNLEEAEVELLQVLREEPKLGIIYVRLAILYSTMGQLDDALRMILRGRAADPLCPVLLSTETFIRLCRREFDEAAVCGKSSIDLHPYQHVGRVHYADALERTGRVDEALAELRLVCVMSPDLPWLRALEGRCLARHGRLSEALAALDELQRLREHEYVDAYFMALLLDAFGKRDEAFTELERALRENSATLFLLDVDVRGQELRKDPRFKHLRRKVFGAPDSDKSVACRAVGT
jgi:DNA-binding winged helix-turn-helix (wHTH) protein/tetratricopeptide (TPR) repeat protein